MPVMDVVFHFVLILTACTEDSGGDTSSLRAALTIAETLAVPILPAGFDVRSLEPLDNLI